MNLCEHIRKIPDFPREGILYRDITPLLSNPDAFEYAISKMTGIAKDLKPDVIVGIESRGFMFAIPISMNLGLPFVPVRKKGKLPYQTVSVSYELEYGGDSLEIHTDALTPGTRVLIVDDLIATGGTVKACVELVGGLNAKVVGVVTLIDLVDIRNEDWFPDININSLIKY
ncbi:MAG: adenine phosphoribosyltransferase [Chloroflexi bacterium]|nr:adenine phosphoribosyltransferase [Chloroflexota bacterium]|tara:strand:+ start:1637 stop:2149 length:513 start_codon:yes stop_codon:yes gene_type:complete